MTRAPRLRRFARGFFRRWTTPLGLAILLGVIAMAVSAPYVFPEDPFEFGGIGAELFPGRGQLLGRVGQPAAGGGGIDSGGDGRFEHAADGAPAAAPQLRQCARPKGGTGRHYTSRLEFQQQFRVED